MLQARNRREHSRVSLSPKGHERAGDVNNMHQASHGAKRTLRFLNGALGGVHEGLSHKSLLPQIHQASAPLLC